MNTIEFIKEHGINGLTEKLGIKVRREGGLVVLNYDQIESPKTDPVVMECRGLILEEDTLNVVSRSYDRFFNLGEALNVTPVIDWMNARVVEKVDGSLIRIYCHDYKWEVATRGTAFADVPVGDWGITFRQLTFKALGVETEEEFQELMNLSCLDSGTTYIFELTSVENRVVRAYEGYKLHFLGSRKNHGGFIDSHYEKQWLMDDACLLSGVIEFPKEYRFESEQDCLDAVRELKNLDEGYVLYQGAVPTCKIKSPAYVAVHHIRGEGLNPRYCAELVLSGEEDEYLTYFPTDADILEPYISAYGILLMEIRDAYRSTKHIENQKDFALAIAEYKFKGVLFTTRSKGGEWQQHFNETRLSWRVELLKEYVEE
ncbi:MAG: RNA ligase [Caudoviricetes sp.]|nr:MAG: RNA ligase [Caudoviricetes sp.]